MTVLALVVAALLVGVVLVGVGDRLRLPWPVLLVLVGAGAASVPGIDAPQFDPELILPLFLPPLLFATAQRASPRAARCSPPAASRARPRGGRSGAAAPRRPVDGLGALKVDQRRSVSGGRALRRAPRPPGR